MWITFKAQIGVRGETQTVGGVTIQTGNGRTVGFTCRYKSQILLDSHNMQVHNSLRPDNENSTSKIGEMNEGFKLTTFADENYATVRDKIHVGDVVYGQVHWQVDLIDRLAV